MKSSLIVAALLLGGVVGLFAEAAKPVAVTVADKGKTVALKVGQEAVVSLHGNASTGYSWNLAGIDGQAVKLDGEVKYIQNSHPPGMVGVPACIRPSSKLSRPARPLASCTIFVCGKKT